MGMPVAANDAGSTAPRGLGVKCATCFEHDTNAIARVRIECGLRSMPSQSCNVGQAIPQEAAASRQKKRYAHSTGNAPVA